MPAAGLEELPSGTSTAVGPSFFVGQRVELRSNSGSHETANTLRTLGWAGVAAGALFVVAVLEWQTWRPATNMASVTGVVARAEAPDTNQTTSGAEPGSSANVAAVPVSEPAPSNPVLSRPTVRSTAQAQDPESTPGPAAPRVSEDGATDKVKLLRTAMRQGDTDAPVSLANMYLEGKDVSRSCEQAMHLLESAAAKNNARARNRLAALYEIGTCVQRDRVQAYRWLNSALAADRNNSWAQQNLDQTWREMTSEERIIAEAYR